MFTNLDYDTERSNTQKLIKLKKKTISLNDKYYLDISKVVNELEIPIIDLRKKLLEKNNDPLSLLPFRMIGHFNEYGNKVISNLIFSEVK